MTTSTSEDFHPDKAFVRRHVAHFIAFGGGAGLSPAAPGTAGTLAAFPLFWVLDYFLDPVKLLLLIAGLFLIGIWACNVTGKARRPACQPAVRNRRLQSAGSQESFSSVTVCTRTIVFPSSKRRGRKVDRGD